MLVIVNDRIEHAIQPYATTITFLLERERESEMGCGGEDIRKLVERQVKGILCRALTFSIAQTILTETSFRNLY